MLSQTYPGPSFLSCSRPGLIIFATAATAVFAYEPLRSQLRLSNTDDNLLAPTRMQAPRVTQSVGVRVGSGSHLLSELKPAFTVGDRKPWHEQPNLLLITGTALRSSLHTCIHGRCTRVRILPDTLLDSSLGPSRFHGSCLHSCLEMHPIAETRVESRLAHCTSICMECPSTCIPL